MILLITFIILCFGFMVLLVKYTIKSIRESKLAFLSTKGLSDTDRAMMEWQDKNPYGSVYDPDFQDLLKCNIGAYLIWKAYHPYCSDDGSLERLDSYVV
ncbi:MAG: hypothetical protein HW401_143 [Parcubacteria group bacterium]|nr:hypothetical protein [Parcubacteria group bacterium]